MAGVKSNQAKPKVQRADNDCSVAVDQLRALAFAVCKIDRGAKKPTYKGWPTRSLEPDDFQDGDLIGILGGPLSSGNKEGHSLIIIDLDDAEALRRADEFLPSTGMVEGKPHKPRDHRYYLVPNHSIPEWAESTAYQAAPAAKKKTGHAGPWKKPFCHKETKTRLIDFIGTGGQAVCPSPGANERQWEGGEPGEPAVVDFMELWEAVCKLAVACGGEDLTPAPAGNTHQADNGAFTMRASNVVSIEERAIKYLAKLPPAIEHKGGHDQTMEAARVVVYGFDLGPEVGFQILNAHYNPRCEPPWSEKELRHKCSEADRVPFSKSRGWLLAEDATKRHETNGTHKHTANGEQSKQSSSRFTIGSLVLNPGQPRQTPSGKISLPVTATKDGKTLFPFVLSSVASGRKEPERLLRQFLGEDPAREKIDSVLTNLLAYAADQLTQRVAPNGPTVREIIADKVPEALQLVCRTEKGLWSEFLGEEMRRCDLTAFTPDWLILESGKGSDAPKDMGGIPVRADLIRLVQVELAVIWADLLSTLPPAADVDLGKDTERGRAFRRAMIRLWKTPLTWEKHSTTSGDTATKASLASRVSSQFSRERTSNRIAWEPVHPACDGWWRPYVFPSGEMRPLLAMRWTLPGQIGVDLPGVTDEASLMRLGKKFGVLADPPEGVPSRLSGGTNRLGVLSLELCEELLEKPTEDCEENPREPGAEG